MKIRAVIVLCFLSPGLNAQVSLLPIQEYKAGDSIHQSAILISAPWCKWCTKMKSHTLEDNRLKDLPRKWVVYQFDYELQVPILFGTQLFEPQSDGPHDLAKALCGRENIEVPYFIILNDSNEVVFEHNGYLNAKELESVLRSKK